MAVLTGQEHCTLPDLFHPALSLRSAEEVNWTYCPGGNDLVHGPLLGTYVFFSAAPEDLAGSFVKAQYVGYTDATFKVREIQRRADVGSCLLT